MTDKPCFEATSVNGIDGLGFVWGVHGCFRGIEAEIAQPGMAPVQPGGQLDRLVVRGAVDGDALHLEKESEHGLMDWYQVYRRWKLDLKLELTWLVTVRILI